MTKGSAIVTGATGAVGSQIALGLAEEGYNIVVHYYRSEKAAMALQKQIEQRGVRSMALAHDFSSGDGYEEFMVQIQDYFPDCRWIDGVYRLQLLLGRWN